MTKPNPSSTETHIHPSLTLVHTYLTVTPSHSPRDYCNNRVVVKVVVFSSTSISYV